MDKNFRVPKEFKEWLEVHPLKNDPNAFVWITMGG